MTLFFAPPARFDAIIVGARCAGAATAMLMARAGMRVLVVDRQDYGSDTLSTHALMRTGVALLHEWGVLERLLDAGTPLVRRTTFDYGGERLPIDIKPEGGVEGLVAPRRTVLDRMLVDAATAAGAEFRFGCTVTDLMRAPDGRVAGVALRDRMGQVEALHADLVVGADGRASKVAEAVGARVFADAPATSAGLYAHVPGARDQGYRWFFRPGAHMAEIPTNDGEHCLCVVVPRSGYGAAFGEDAATGFLAAVRSFDPEVADGIAPAMRDVSLKRWAGAPGFMRDCHGPGWALVGDAGYFKDPLTAHGITDALKDATLLAEAVVAGRPARYQVERDALSRPLFDVTREISAFRWTLEELKALHMELNGVMKSEHAYMVGAETRAAVA